MNFLRQGLTLESRLALNSWHSCLICVLRLQGCICISGVIFINFSHVEKKICYKNSLTYPDLLFLLLGRIFLKDNEEQRQLTE